LIVSTEETSQPITTAEGGHSNLTEELTGKKKRVRSRSGNSAKKHIPSGVGKEEERIELD
jgi:hypothetical protein